MSRPFGPRTAQKVGGQAWKTPYCSAACVTSLSDCLDTRRARWCIRALTGTRCWQMLSFSKQLVSLHLEFKSPKSTCSHMAASAAIAYGAKRPICNYELTYNYSHHHGVLLTPPS